MNYRNPSILVCALSPIVLLACGGSRDHRLGGSDGDGDDISAGGAAGQTDFGENSMAGSGASIQGGSFNIGGAAQGGSFNMGGAAQGGSFNLGGSGTLGGAVATGGTGPLTTGGTGPLTTGGMSTGGSDTSGGTNVGGTTSAQCEKEGAPRCLGTAQRGREACQSGQYRRVTDCSEDQLCNSSTGECQPILPTCSGKQAGFAFCDGAQIRVCDIDLVSSSVSKICENSWDYCIESSTGPFCGHAIPQCVTEGSHRCTGNAQRGREVCRAFAYEADVDCPEGRLCDSDTGECKPILPECEGRTSGYAYCDGPRDLRVCGSDLVSSSLSNTCEFRCIEGKSGAACGAAICGDHIRQRGEECDDGNTLDGDACPANCRIPVRALITGENHACALGANGVLKCWGYNGDCQLGIGSEGNRGDEPNEMGEQLPAVKLGSSASTSTIVGGMVFSCALLENGRVKCWGSGNDGELGFGTLETRGCDPAGMGDALPPVELGTGVTAAGLMAGYRHACARTSDDRVKCWGMNLGGQLGLGDATFNAAVWGDHPSRMGDALPFVPLTSSQLGVRAIAGGYAQSCAIFSDYRLKCWGYNVEAELGLGLPLENDAQRETYFVGDDPGEMGDALPFVQLPSGRKPIQVIGGDFDTCALLDDGSVVCWGLGVGDAPEEMGDHLLPIPLGTGRTAKMLAKNRYNQCVILDNGAVKCWGRSGFALGLGDTRARVAATDLGDNLPKVELGTGRTALSIAVANGFACALLDDHTVKCWGGNKTGALGLGDTEDRGDEPGEMGDALPTVDLAF